MVAAEAVEGWEAGWLGADEVEAVEAGEVETPNPLTRQPLFIVGAEPRPAGLLA
jgi:hypothetical protein